MFWNFWLDDCAGKIVKKKFIFYLYFIVPYIKVFNKSHLNENFQNFPRFFLKLRTEIFHQEEDRGIILLKNVWLFNVLDAEIN